MPHLVTTATYPVLRAIEAGEITAEQFASRALRTSRRLDRIERRAQVEINRGLRNLDRDIRDAIVAHPNANALTRGEINRVIDDAVDQFRDNRRLTLQRATIDAVDQAQSFRQDIAKVAGKTAPSAPVTGKLAEDLITIQNEANNAFADDIRARNKAEVVNGVADGKTPNQIANEMAAKRVNAPSRIRDDPVAHGSLAQAEKQTRTEVRQAFNTANFAQSQAEGRAIPGTKKIWVTQMDTDVRPSHRSAGRRYSVDGDPGPVPLRQKFLVGEARLRFPNDPAGPPGETVNCRCFMVEITPEVKEELE